MFLRIGLAGLCSVSLLFSASLSNAQDLGDAHKIVSIGGSVTEIFYALGEEGRLVARDLTSIYPPQANALPHVGYMRQLSAEGVLSVGPDAIVSIEGAGPLDAMTLLGNAGVPLVSVPEDHSAQGVIQKVEVVGKALGVEDKAASLVSELRRKFEASDKVAQGIAPADRRKVMFVLSVQSGRLMVSGTGTAADAMIAMAGGVNAFPDYDGYKPVADEAIIAAAPDIIILMDRGDGQDAGIANVMQNPAVQQTPAGDQKRVTSVDGAFMLGFGPRTPDAVSALTQAIYSDTAAAAR